MFATKCAGKTTIFHICTYVCVCFWLKVYVSVCKCVISAQTTDNNNNKKQCNK